MCKHAKKGFKQQQQQNVSVKIAAYCVCTSFFLVTRKYAANSMLYVHDPDKTIPTV